MSDKKLAYTNDNINFKTVLEDGLREMRKSDAEGFEYTVGEIMGGKVKVTFEPDSTAFDTIDIDGVNGFGYTLVVEV